MLKALIPVIFAVAAGNLQTDPATRQLAHYKNTTMGCIGILTTGSGAPVEYKEATNTINSEFLDNHYLLDVYTHTARKTIAERVLHASGTGAFGYFTTTNSIPHITKAKLFSKVGKKTPVTVRFSPSFSSIGVRDTVRESRGFATKFYTEEGNYDLTAINFEMFAFKDPVLFPTLTHVTKRNPATNLPDNTAIWDFLVHHTEALNEFTRLFSYKGMPYSYAHMEGFAVHTMQFYDESGCSHFGRWRWHPLAGVKYFNASAASSLPAGDPDYFTRDLYNRIASGNYPQWELQLQIIPDIDVEIYDLDIFDPTMDLPLEKYPTFPVGVLTLDKNPTNHFAEIEVLAFTPGNVVPGILGSPDKLFQARRFVYRDTQNHRLGNNHHRIPVNSPKQVKTSSYNRDGVPPLGDNYRDAPNYYPNTFNGPEPYRDDNRPILKKVRQTAEVRNFKQAAKFYSSLNFGQKLETVDNMVEHMCSVEPHIKRDVVKVLKTIHSDLGRRVAEGLAAKCSY